MCIYGLKGIKNDCPFFLSDVSNTTCLCIHILSPSKIVSLSLQSNNLLLRFRGKGLNIDQWAVFCYNISYSNQFFVINRQNVRSVKSLFRHHCAGLSSSVSPRPTHLVPRSSFCLCACRAFVCLPACSFEERESPRSQCRGAAENSN